MSRLLPVFAVLASAATCVPAADFAPEHDVFFFSQLTAGFTSTPSVEVTERTRSSGGTNTTYAWKDTDKRGTQVAFNNLNGHAQEWGGWVWGIEVNGMTQDITPDSFDVNDTNYGNGSNSTLTYRSFGAAIQAGYQYGIIDEPEGISGFLTIVPFYGLELTRAESEIRTDPQSLSYQRSSGNGWGYDTGIRVGGYLTEKHWLLGLTIDARYGRSVTNIDFSDGSSSDLTVIRRGVGFGLAGGYRF
ncbi:MAG: hypothetical protein H0W78_16220 [Planctomycetes bacterium]|nr:hypothetical protein [Planctomycetota bacterium]